MSGFGAGFGSFVGSSLGASDLNAAKENINNTADNFTATQAPNIQFGQSFLQPAAGAINSIQATAGADPNLNYNTFMKNYETSPGAAYDIGVANNVQNTSAAARGGVLSGANERALAETDTGIANKYANTAFTNYLAGNNQQFGQLEQSLGNMFGAIGVGSTATGQVAGIDTSQMNADASIAAAQAKNDQSKGSGLGSMFGGLGSVATMF